MKRSASEAGLTLLNSANLTTWTNSTVLKSFEQRYVQDIEFRSFDVYCITLSAHFVNNKKKIKSNIIYNSGSRVIMERMWLLLPELRYLLSVIGCKIRRWREIARFSG